MKAGGGDKGAIASIRARLEKVARARNVEFQLVLAEFAIERFLYRLASSEYSSEFVLKGAMLLRLWIGENRRATWDLDLLKLHRTNVDDLERIVREVCAMDGEDGLLFALDTVRGEVIRAAQEEGGVRIRLEARR